MRVALAEDGRRDFEVASEAHVTAEWIGSVKQGVTKNPPLDKLRAVAQVLGKPTSYFTIPLGYIPLDEAAVPLSAAETAVLAAFREELARNGAGQKDSARRQPEAAASGS